MFLTYVFLYILCITFIVYFFKLQISINDININVNNKIDFDLPFPINYDDKFFFTNIKKNFNKKYYEQGDYFHNILPNNITCENTCKNFVYNISKTNTISATGFRIKYINNSCECEGQLLNIKKLQYYPKILFVDNYNDKYFKKNHTCRAYIFSHLFSNKNENCRLEIEKYAKSVYAEAVLNYSFFCKNQQICKCQGDILYLK